MGLLKNLRNLLKGRSQTAAADDGNWNVFMREQDGRPATILINLAFTDHPPPPQLPIWVDVSIAFEHADENGLPESGEMDRIAPTEERLVAALTQAGAVQVGASSTNGRRHCYFYAPTPDVRAAADQTLTACRARSPALQMREDPAWTMYHKRLRPNAIEQRMMDDNRVLVALAQAGDNGEHERKIEHWAYFDSRAQADRFAMWASDQGFDVEEITTPGEDQHQHGVRFSHTGPAIPGAITQWTALATEGAADCGGEYDGWETIVVK